MATVEPCAVAVADAGHPVGLGELLQPARAHPDHVGGGLPSDPVGLGMVDVTPTVPVEVTTDRAPPYPRVLDELIASATHTTEQYANNAVEDDQGRLKARLRPLRG